MSSFSSLIGSELLASGLFPNTAGLVGDIGLRRIHRDKLKLDDFLHELYMRIHFRPQDFLDMEVHSVRMAIATEHHATIRGVETALIVKSYYNTVGKTPREFLLC